MKTLYIGKNKNEVQWSVENTEISVLYSNNGLEAINILKTQKDIGAIICEYNLSGNNGLFLHQQLKEEYNLSSIPFVLLLEEHSPKIYSEAFKAGVNDYFVMKSTSIEQIILRTRQLAHQNKETAVPHSTSKPATYKFPISKRIFDITIASFILLMLSPLLLIIIIAIRIESKGKVYYIAKRVGRKTFDFYKLRSMHNGSDKLLKQLAKEKNQYSKTPDTTKTETSSCPRCNALPKGEFCSPVKYAEENKVCDYWYMELKKQDQSNNSSFIKIVDDPRITKVGKIIRNTSIDELPQLINVIKGDMSLVGNRPLPVYEAELLTQDQMSKRFLAPAGITGLWQVELRGKGGDMSEEERIALDNRYADYFTGNNYSLWFDLKILLRTVPALFQKSTV
ncbi:sugar transferase [Winogradskyella sediminis]|uniref:sugar transferase n=1 Tax=Winogradskyella sediminis TaxID=1382466 RepID=UPI000E27B341|nr:sugar transferase [Winogradskyella sediminis]REG89754.1 response regulator receiver domain-containing protein [Winogradskyella sediminis]